MAETEDVGPVAPIDIKANDEVWIRLHPGRSTPRIIEIRRDGIVIWKESDNAAPRR